MTAQTTVANAAPERTLRVKMVIYDDVETTAENPIVVLNEPFYGEDEIKMQAASLARDLRRYQETEQ